MSLFWPIVLMLLLAALVLLICLRWMNAQAAKRTPSPEYGHGWCAEFRAGRVYLLPKSEN